MTPSERQWFEAAGYISKVQVNLVTEKERHYGLITVSFFFYWT